ncbi:hypothetical protein CYMTET_29246 [Cymbomonas tetramitiformis]|uniref:Uncharacterized protein n=1 Tax=Cymbomonas tetramitiformis TaxID=36881 RepID=A0AAE0FLU2_9CHLO|nr:hypothetical protein CYMTET_29246 [Cymbomonas tetramitiformis]
MSPVPRSLLIGQSPFQKSTNARVAHGTDQPEGSTPVRMPDQTVWAGFQSTCSTSDAAAVQSDASEPVPGFLEENALQAEYELARQRKAGAAELAHQKEDAELSTLTAPGALWSGDIKIEPHGWGGHVDTYFHAPLMRACGSPSLRAPNAQHSQQEVSRVVGAATTRSRPSQDSADRSVSQAHTHRLQKHGFDSSIWRHLNHKLPRRIADTAHNERIQQSARTFGDLGVTIPKRCLAPPRCATELRDARGFAGLLALGSDAPPRSAMHEASQGSWRLAQVAPLRSAVQNVPSSVNSVSA